MKTKDNKNMEKKEIRRLRLKEWFSDKTLPANEKSYLSQLMGGKASFGEKAARRLEQTYGMPDGYLDAEPVEQDEGLNSPQSGLTRKEIELLQIFSAFPDEDKDKILKELKEEKEYKEKEAERWFRARGGRA